MYTKTVVYFTDCAGLSDKLFTWRSPGDGVSESSSADDSGEQ